jgi:hypothetical protein
MGFLKGLRASMGGVDENLIKSGTLARGTVVECRPTGMSTGREGAGLGIKRVCEVTVEISGLPGKEPYQVTCKHPIPVVYLPQMRTAGATVAVRVDPADPQHIALDLTTDPPAPGADPSAGSVSIATPDGDVDVPTHKSPLTAAQILEQGVACTATLLMSTPLGQKNDAGLDVMGLVFTITLPSGHPYQSQIGVGVPPDAMRLLYPNAVLPARAMPDWLQNPSPPDMVTIDWTAAMSQQQ